MAIFECKERNAEVAEKNRRTQRSELFFCGLYSENSTD